MSLEYIRRTYGVPARRGGRVRYTGSKHAKGPQDGTITGTTGGRLRIRLDGDRYSLPFHPTWELEYIAESESAAQSKRGNNDGN